MATGGSGNSDTASGNENHPAKNLLCQEKSPYLLQHASNPVHWFAWGPEAFEKAKKESKLIFLSVGYSTCHWCHVMEKESFEDKDIAEIMNEHFINIKVDREERPDVDKVYMTYVQATRGSGGWPMSVWLTPDLKPVFGGTYFPPDDRYFGQPGFKTVLSSLAKQWKENREKFYKSGTAVLDLLTQHTTISASSRGTFPEMKVASKCYHQLMEMYEPEYGGFSKHPKFPQVVNFKFLFHYYHTKPGDKDRQKALDACLHTLKMMSKGGIHDHVGKGFHRYSTDTKWHVPHFEKMLYDQAQLSVIYLEAFQLTKDPVFADVARDILEYVERDLSHESGGFYSAEDADSYAEEGAPHKQEGAFCVWEKSEVTKLLDVNVEGKNDLKLHQLVCEYFSIKDNGNVDPYQDPHDELKNKNVLIVSKLEEQVAEMFGLTLEVFRQEIKLGCKMMFEARLKRPKPHLDDKMIAAWNGLMLSGFAKAAQVFNEEKYLSRATKAASFIQTHLYQSSPKKLLRSCYRGKTGEVVQIERPINAFVDDYVFVIQGLLDLYEASGDDKWLEFAVSLQKLQNELFWDSDGGAYFMTSGTDKSILLRLKEDQDGAEPNSNSVALINLLRLSHMLDDPTLNDKAESILETYVDRLNMLSAALPLMVSGVILFHEQMKKVVVVGSRTAPDTLALLDILKTNYLPNKVLIEVNGEGDTYILQQVPSTTRMKKKDDKATVYVCKGRTCSEPITNPTFLKKFLDITPVNP